MAENSPDAGKPSSKKQASPKKENTKKSNPDKARKPQPLKAEKTPRADKKQHKEKSDSSAAGSTSYSMKGTVEDSLNTIREKIEHLSSGDKISDEYEKAKVEARKISWLSDIKTAFRFFTRLPLPASETEVPMHGNALWAAPLVGIVVGLMGGLVFSLSIFLGLPAYLSSCLALTIMIAATGCFHEDAIADVADGFGGGWTAEQKLEIMQDSRIGTYGATALFLTLLIKIGAFTALSHFAETPFAFVLLLIASSTASRTAGVAVLALLPPVRAEGRGREAGTPSTFTLIFALSIGSVITILSLAFGFGFSAMLAGLAGAIIGGGFVGWLAHRQIGGQTGDVAGAGQQVSEIGLLLSSLIALSV